MGLSPDQVKYTIQLVCIASLQRLVGSKPKIYVWEEWHIYPQTVASVNYHYKNTTKPVGLAQIGHRHHFIECSLLLQRYIWAIAHLAVKHNHSHSIQNGFLAIKFCCTGNHAYVEINQSFYWILNPLFWEKSQPVHGSSKQSCFALQTFYLRPCTKIFGTEWLCIKTLKF
jgi:hypothetical protein